MMIGACDICNAQDVEISRSELAGLETWSCSDGCHASNSRQQPQLSADQLISRARLRWRLFEFLELPDGRAVCFCPGGRWHGWLFYRHADGHLMPMQELLMAPKPYGPELNWGENPND